MVANIQKRGKGETEAKLFHLPIHPSVVFICLCAHPPLRYLLSPPHQASSSRLTAVKTLMMCDSAAICWRSLMGGFFFPGAALQTLILSAGGSLPAFVKALQLKFKSALILHHFLVPFG